MLVPDLSARSPLSPEYMLREWHEADGLPEDEIGSVTLDEAGYLWVAASGGLARFDGAAFENVKMPADVFARGMVYGRFKNRPAELVAVSEGGNERRKEKTTGGFYRYDAGEFRFVEETLLAGKVVRVAFFGALGELWLGTDDGFLLRRDGGERVMFESIGGAAGGRRTPTFASDAKGRTWASVGPQVARFEKGAWLPASIDSRDNEVRLGSSASGGVWLFTRTDVLRWDEAAGRFTTVAKLPDLLGAHFIQATLEDRTGRLWIGTRSQGLFRLEGKNFVRVPTSNDEITALCEDGKGNLWVGTNGGGLNRLRLRAHRIFDQTSGLKDNFSYTVAEGENGEMWLGNRDGGVARVINGVADPLSRRANWRSFSAMSVYPAANGGWWMTTGIGVYRTEPGKPETLQRVAALANTKLVRVSYVARNGDYWVSLDPDRVGRLRDGQLTTFGKTEGFDGREVRAIAEDGGGTIWVAAAEGRLFRCQAERFEPVALEEPARFGALQSLRFEDDGTLLVGTTRYGVLIFPQGDLSRMHALNSDQGLPSSNISGVLADDLGRYWFASRGGVFWANRNQVRDYIDGKVSHVHAVLLGRDEGVPDLSCLGLFQPSVWRASDGTLWFATRRGVLNTDPALVPEDADLPPVTIAEIRGDGQPLAVGKTLAIAGTVRKIEVRFSVLNLAAPDRTVVRYRLEGFDDDWVLPRDRVATYPRLAPGHYVLHASASSGSGTWDEQQALLTIEVVPAWWQSTWARLLYFAAGVTVVALLVRIWSLRRWRRRLAKMEQERAIERERTRIAQDIHDDMGASLTRISLLSQSAGGGEAPAADVLEQIYETTHTITRSMDEIVWAINPKFDDLESLVYYLTTFAQKFLSAAKLRFRLEAPDVLPAIAVNTQVRHHVFLCCKEALNNIVKHARASEVTLSVELKENVLEIAVADDGQSGAGAEANAARIVSGHGVENMRQRMSELGGTCAVVARSPHGTVICLSIPLASSGAGKNHARSQPPR